MQSYLGCLLLARQGGAPNDAIMCVLSYNIPGGGHSQYITVYLYSDLKGIVLACSVRCKGMLFIVYCLFQGTFPFRGLVQHMLIHMYCIITGV